MDLLSVNSYTKINLSIDILGKREDGYHLVDMIMQTVPMYDKILIYKPEAVPSLRDDVLSEILAARKKQEERVAYFQSKGIQISLPDASEKILITCTNPKLPVDKKNLAYRAAQLLMEEQGYTGKIAIHIRKKIPVGGGLGGGSSNAAAVLKGVNELLGFGYTNEQLCEKAQKLGSDVPFLVNGGTALATGVGTDLRPLPPFRYGYILIVNPNIFLSTERVYTKFDSLRISPESHPDTNALVQALKDKDYEGFMEGMKNVLEFPAFDLEPAIKKLKTQISLMGAKKVLMSGSGSTVFGIFETKEEVINAMNKFRRAKLFAVGVSLMDDTESAANQISTGMSPEFMK